MDMRIFRREMHRPSGVKEWQIPAGAQSPNPPRTPRRADPDEEQETSYFAPSVRIVTRSSKVRDERRAGKRLVMLSPRKNKIEHQFAFIITHFFDLCKGNGVYFKQIYDLFEIFSAFDNLKNRKND